MRAWQRQGARVATFVGTIILTSALLGGGIAVAQLRHQTNRNGSGNAPSTRTITVVGTGQVRGTPDVLDLTLGVSTRDKGAAAALTRNSALSKKLNGVLRDAGVAEKDLQTADLSISPVYDDNNKNVIAYSVSNTVDVTIRHLDKAGDIIDAAAKVAGNEIVVNSLAFSFDDSSALVAQARTEAVKRAKSQAKQLAKAADVHLGDVLTITESSAPPGPVVAAAPSAASADAAVPPIKPGSQSLSVQVNMVFKIT